MDYSKRQADPRRHLTGIAFVVAFHALLVYGLMSGLARKVVEVVRAPIETKVIEEVVKPPPPPEVVVPPPPKLEAPPPPFIPPPEVQIATPPPPAPTITATPTPPPEPTLMTPPAPPVAAAPAPAAPAAPVSAAVVCSNFATKMGEAGFPREAIRQGLDKGEVVIKFTLTPSGEIKNIRTVSATHPIFARNSVRIVSEYKCAGQGREVEVTVPFGYKLE